MVPLWLLVLGQYIAKTEHYTIQIPYTNILTSLFCLVISLGIGVLITKYRPVWGKKLLKTLKPISIFFIIFMFTVGVYANMYIFELLTPLIALAGCMLPYIGFGVSCLVAVILKQPWPRIKAIAIETGIQNTGIAILLLKMSLPQPEADMSFLAPVMVATFTPFPLIIAIIYVEIRKRFKGFKKVRTDGHDDTHSDEEIGDNEELENNANVIYKPANGEYTEHLVSKGDDKDRELAVVTSQNGDVASGEMP